jgi:hypothetical protein
VQLFEKTAQTRAHWLRLEKRFSSSCSRLLDERPAVLGLPGLPSTFRPAAIGGGLVIRPDKIDMAYTKRGRKLKQGEQSRISLSALEIAHILLCKSRYFGELLLRESLLATKSREIAADKLAHIHARRLARHTS